MGWRFEMRLKKYLLGGIFAFLTIMFCAGAINAQTITVTAPASGASWYKGATNEITWTKSGRMSTYVSIELFDQTASRKILDIVRYTPNNDSFSWTIPVSITDDSYRIRVRTIDGRVTDDSDPFQIRTTSLLPAREMRRLETTLPTPVVDYSIESLELGNAAGVPLIVVEGDRRFNYNGSETNGTAVVRVRWTRVPPPAGCAVQVELLMRYPTDRSRPISVGTQTVTDFNPSGIASVRIPFTVRAGQPNNSMVNLQANLLFTRAGCDSNPTGNSLAYDIKLWARPATDLALQLNAADFRLTRGYQLEGAHANEHYHFEHKARVRNFGTVSGPIRNVRCKWEIYLDYGSPTEPNVRRARSGYFTIESLTGGEWVEKKFSSRDLGGEVIWILKNYWNQVLLVVEVDPDNVLGDTNRSNNRFEYRFRLR